MKQNNFRLIIILGAVAIIGIIIVQIYWMQKAWSTSQKQFNQTIQIALQNVANKIFKYNNIQPPIDNPVDQLSASYFVVNTNSEIDPNILEYYLISEFNLKNINIDFEYGIYNCNNDKMVYGNYISSEGETETTHFSKNLQKHSDYIYYFGVNFPTRKKFILSNISVWIVFSTILLVVIIFFTYSLFIIMQQKRLSEQQRDFIN
ncbi:MAG: hypothetical protein JXB17_09985, partial [Bacteroidales bacterium]|nr:hypothetical protein [Bacteroidales bacterium]